MSVDVYIDDIGVFSLDWTSHTSVLIKFLQSFRNQDLRSTQQSVNGQYKKQISWVSG